MTVSEQVQMIAASLWIEPATFERLAERFKDKYAQFSIWNLLVIAKNHRKWVYQRGETYFTYKDCVVNVLNPAGYELDLKEELKSDFRKKFERYLG